MDDAFLVLPRDGDHRFRRLARKLQIRALGGLLRWSEARGPARLAAAITAAARKDRDQLLSLLAHPDIFPLLLVAEAGLRPPAPLLTAASQRVALALSRRGALTETLLWGQPRAGSLSELIDVVTDRRWSFQPAAQGLLITPVGAEIRSSDGALRELARDGGAPTGVPIRPGLALGLIDSNPLADIEDHPDKDGNALSLGGRPAEEWVQALREALDLIDVALPAWAAELPAALRRIVPVGFEPERHLSASYREAPGLCYLTLHPDPLTLAEAIIHETQHSKLNVLASLDPVLRNGQTTWTASPVRPDLRPLMGVLLAVHAFVPVAALHAELARRAHPSSSSAHFMCRQAQVLSSNARGLSVLHDLAEPTPAGQRLLKALSRQHASLHAASAGPLPPIEDRVLKG